jgi:hypothetical protein
MSLHTITHPADALVQILTFCAQSTTYTRRIQLIHEAAMRGLGMTASQRHARHMENLTRTKQIGPDHDARMAKRIAEQMQTNQRQLRAEAIAAGLPAPIPDERKAA